MLPKFHGKEMHGPRVREMAAFNKNTRIPTVLHVLQSKYSTCAVLHHRLRVQ